MDAILRFTDFSRLWTAAQAVHSRFDYLAKYGQQYAEAGIIYDMAHGGVKAVRALTGLPQRKFSAAYGIPRVTYERWESGSHMPPPYVMMLLAYAVLSDAPHTQNDLDRGGQHDGF